MTKRFQLVHRINDLLFNRMRFPGSRKLGRLISRTFLPKLGIQKVKVPTIFGFDMFLNKNGGQEIYSLGFYEVGTLHVISVCLREEDVFVDVGASIGQMSLYAAQCSKKGKVLSFEPQKERCEILRMNRDTNGFGHITVFNNGLGEEREIS